MKIFICGLSNTGKTTFAKTLAEKLNETSISPKFKPISASGFVRREFMNKPEALREELEDFGRKSLQKDPNVAVRFLEEETDSFNGNFIIEGIRNPRDFAMVFDPTKDFVVIQDVSVEDARFLKSEFDRGVWIIREFCEWHRKNGVWIRNCLFRFYPYKKRMSELTIGMRLESKEEIFDVVTQELGL